MTCGRQAVKGIENCLQNRFKVKKDLIICKSKNSITLVQQLTIALLIPNLHRWIFMIRSVNFNAESSRATIKVNNDFIQNLLATNFVTS